MKSLFILCLTLALSYATNYAPAQSNYRVNVRMPISQDVIPTETVSYGAKTGYQQIRPQFDQPKPSMAYAPQSRLAMGYSMQMDTPPQPLPLTPEDIMCQGKQPGTVIPLQDTRIYVTCLDDAKGVSQKCPPHLHYITNIPVPRCEKKLSQLLPPCLSNPCQNGGQCQELDIFTYKCSCPVGFEGPQCERDQRACLQNPCGLDGVCKGFRSGSALSFVCLCQDGNAYGPSCTQAIPNPCQGTEQYLSMSYTDKGFVMCDGERFFIESCPATTTWDNQQKSCISPDMPLVQDQSSYSKVTYQQPSGYSSYSEPVKSWSIQTDQPMKPRTQMGSMMQQFDMVPQKSMMSPQMQQFDMTPQKPMMMMQQFDNTPQKPVSSQGYGQPQQQFDMPPQKPMMMQQFDSTPQKPIISQGYGQPQQQLDIQPPTSMYSSRPVQQDVPVSGYGSGIQQQFDTPKPHRPQHIGRGFSQQQFDSLPDTQMNTARYSDSSMLSPKPIQQDVQPSISSYSGSTSPMLEQRRSSIVQQPQFDAYKQQNVGY